MLTHRSLACVLCIVVHLGLLPACSTTKVGGQASPGGQPIAAPQAQHKQEVFFEFQTLPGDTFIVKLIDVEKIKEAREILQKKYQKHVVGTIVKSPQPYNKPWRYHLAPNSIEFVLVTDQACDGAIRYVEDRLNAVGVSILPEQRWCPSTSRLVREVMSVQSSR
ncbi:MAG: BP74-related protein [Nitrospiraceae bacterium]